MTDFRVTIEVDTASPYFRRVAETAKRQLQDAVNLWAFRTRGTAIKGIQRGPKSGNVYMRGSVSHQASAPGEYPASDTGYLASHVFAQPGPGYADVGTTAKYGPYLEQGTGRMAARPWLLPSLEPHTQEIEKVIRRILEP